MGLYFLGPDPFVAPRSRACLFSCCVPPAYALEFCPHRQWRGMRELDDIVQVASSRVPADKDLSHKILNSCPLMLFVHIFTALQE